MIRFTLNSDTYGLGFKHTSKKEAVPVKESPVFLETFNVRYTTCTIYRIGADGKPVGNAVASHSARCSPLDNFVKEVGRKVALTRTLDRWTAKLDPVLGRTLRAAAWAGYFERNEAQEARRQEKEAKAAQERLAAVAVDLALTADAPVETHPDGAK